MSGDEEVEINEMLGEPSGGRAWWTPEFFCLHMLQDTSRATLNWLNTRWESYLRLIQILLSAKKAEKRRKWRNPPLAQLGGFRSSDLPLYTT
jgi:hypothetical protein